MNSSTLDNGRPIAGRLNAVYWGAFILCIGYYFGVGGFPFGDFKGDGVSIAIGSLQMAQRGWDSPRIDYGRETRPGIFATLIGLEWLSGADPYVLFSLMSLAAGVACVIVTALFVSRLLHIPAPLCGVAILVLFPDSSFWACYPNGTVVAGCLGMMAMYVLVRTEQPGATTLLLAGVLAGLSVLARVDAILLGLMSLPLLYTSDRREMSKRLVVFGVPAGIVAVGGIYALGSSVSQILGNTSDAFATAAAGDAAPSFVMRLATSNPVASCLGFFPMLTVFLIILGVVRLLKTRRWNVLWIVGAGLLPVLAVYRTNIYSSPLFYTVPLFALLCLAAFEWFGAMNRRAKYWVGGFAALLFVVQYPIGVSVVLRSKPNYPCPKPTLVVLGEKELSKGPVSKITVGIGAGGALPCTEVLRFGNGLLFHPIALHLVKQESGEAATAMREYLRTRLDDKTPLLIYTNSWAGRNSVNRAIQQLGYSCREAVHGAGGRARSVWQCKDRVITHIANERIADPWKHPELFAAEPPREQMIYVTSGGSTSSLVRASGHVTKTIRSQEILWTPTVSVFEVDMRFE